MSIFSGATHRHVRVDAGGNRTLLGYVKAIRWSRDGDHPKVVRYPIERREWKGLLEVGPKEQYALKFGDWVLEDEAGRLYVVSGQKRVVEELEEASPGLFRKVKKELPSEFEVAYEPISGGGTVAQIVVAMIAILWAFLNSDSTSLPILLGVTHLMYYSALLGQWNGTTNAVFDLDEAADDIKVSAHTNTYAPNQDTHDFFDDVTNEVTGTNYTAGGAALSTQALTRSTNTVTFDAVDVVWTQSGAGFSTARKFVVYRNAAGVAANSRLFSVVTADADVGNVTGDLTIAWNASGIATWSTT